MKIQLLVVLILLPLTGMSQAKFKFQGRIEIRSVSQGGAPRPDNYFRAVPFQTTVYVVKYIDSATVPIIVDTIQSNKDGRFEIELVPDRYGFVSGIDINSLKSGQFFPQSTSTHTGHMYYSTSWESDVSFPIDLRKGNVSGVILTYHSQSSCMDCP